MKSGGTGTEQGQNGSSTGIVFSKLSKQLNNQADVTNVHKDSKLLFGLLKTEVERYKHGESQEQLDFQLSVAKFILAQNGYVLKDTDSTKIRQKAVEIACMVARCFTEDLQFYANENETETVMNGDIPRELADVFLTVFQTIILMQTQKSNEDRDKFFEEVYSKMREIIHGLAMRKAGGAVPNAYFIKRMKELCDYVEEENSRSQYWPKLFTEWGITFGIFAFTLVVVAACCVGVGWLPSIGVLFTTSFLSSTAAVGAAKLTGLFCYAVASALAGILNPTAYRKIKNYLFPDIALEGWFQSLQTKLFDHLTQENKKNNVTPHNQNARKNASKNEGLIERLRAHYDYTKGGTEELNKQFFDYEVRKQFRTTKNTPETVSQSQQAENFFDKCQSGLDNFLACLDSKNFQQAYYNLVCDIELDLNIRYLDSCFKTGHTAKHQTHDNIATNLNKLLEIMKNNDLLYLLAHEQEIEAILENLASDIKKENQSSNWLSAVGFVICAAVAAVILGMVVATLMYGFFVASSWLTLSLIAGNTLTLPSLTAFCIGCVNGTIGVGTGASTLASIGAGYLALEIYNRFEKWWSASSLQDNFNKLKKMTHDHVTTLYAQYEISQQKAMAQQQKMSKLEQAEMPAPSAPPSPPLSPSSSREQEAVSEDSSPTSEGDSHQKQKQQETTEQEHSVDRSGKSSHNKENKRNRKSRHNYRRRGSEDQFNDANSDTDANTPWEKQNTHLQKQNTDRATLSKKGSTDSDASTSSHSSDAGFSTANSDNGKTDRSRQKIRSQEQNTDGITPSRKDNVDSKDNSPSSGKKASTDFAGGGIFATTNKKAPLFSSSPSSLPDASRRRSQSVPGRGAG